MADCDANYFRLVKLFPAWRSERQRSLVLPGKTDRVFLVKVAERTRYTTLLTLEQLGKYGVRWLGLPALTIRLYHDARVAEVVACGGKRSPHPRYDYPNRNMHQQDEKAQWNRFLADFLAHCLAHGREAKLNYEPASQ